MGFNKGIILQGVMMPTVVLPSGQSCLGIKGDVTREYVHAPIHTNSTYVQTVRRYIYKTKISKHPHSPVRHYERRPRGPPRLTSLLQMLERSYGTYILEIWKFVLFNDRWRVKESFLILSWKGYNLEELNVECVPSMKFLDWWYKVFYGLELEHHISWIVGLHLL